MSKHDKDLLISCFVIALAIFIFWNSVRMPMRGDLIESPAVFPGLMGLILFLFGVIYAIRSLARGGRIKFDQLFHSVVPLFTSKKNRPIILGILFPAVY